ncbi:hypothetical protein ACFQFH_16835 [Halobaculum halobium]|uniref:hypothetical protein n=1 Tax=Halobaculum halobium TaxID=3032281 RepID=UPI003607A4D6
MGIGTSLSYRPEAVPDSALVPEPEYPVIVWPDGPARFEVDSDNTYTVYTYELTAERVSSAAAFGADVRERFGFALDELPAEEREILDTAIDSGTAEPDGGPHPRAGTDYHVAHDEEPSPAFRSLVDRFRARDRVVVHEWQAEAYEEWEASGEYVVAYDGTTYWTRLVVDESVFTETPTDGDS